MKETLRFLPRVSGGRKKSLCASFCSMLRLTKEGATPVNWRVVMLVVFTLVSANFTFAMVGSLLRNVVPVMRLYHDSRISASKKL